MHKKLKALRAKKGLRQLDLAKILGIKVNTYNFKENGRVDFNITEIEKLRKFFNLPYEDIFFDD